MIKPKLLNPKTNEGLVVFMVAILVVGVGGMAIGFVMGFMSGGCN